MTHDEETGFAVKGKAVRRLVSRFDLDNEEAIQYLAERLDRLGVYAALQGARGAAGRRGGHRGLYVRVPVKVAAR